ncbi:hypothetical protein CO659_12910 [Rhizobium sp. S9]|nr:hypothetical protein CO659_12910 [Rhizobium sp. S9]
MGKFKVGDKVRRENYGHANFPVGSEGVIAAIDPDGSILLEGDKPGYAHQTYNLSLVKPSAPEWQPKVGDRVRLVKDGRSTTGAIGKTATISSWGGKLIDTGEYLLDIDPPVDYKTMAATPSFTRATIDCFEPLPAFTIEAGKFYKTRDGRKVGPVTEEGYMDVYPFRVPGGPYGKVYIRKDGTANLGMSEKESPLWDLIAEWVDEPAVAVAASNDNAAPAKFKVGDRVRFRADYGSPARGQLATVIAVNVWGNDGIQVDLGGPYGTGFSTEAASDLLLVTPAAPAPTAIVALIENGQPKPATRPYVHATEEAAMREADRLAGVHKGQQFGVYVLTTTSQEAAPVYKHEWQRLAANGNKIAAIKELRAANDLTLKGARDAVLHWLETAA